MKRETPNPKITFDELFGEEPLSHNLYATVEGKGTYVELHLTPEAKMDRVEDILDVNEGLRALPRFIQSPVCRNVQNVVITSWLVTMLSENEKGKKLLDRFGFEVISGSPDATQIESMKKYSATMAASRYQEYVPAQYRGTPPGHARMRNDKLHELKTMELTDDLVQFNKELDGFLESIGIERKSK